MNFQQLRIVRETVRRNFNLTEVAASLFTSQSGVSKHIKDLEDELGVELFVRRGKRLLGLTDPGKEMVDIVERVLADTASIKRLGEQFSNRDQGKLVVATTHTQARYVLPDVIREFRARYPQVRLNLHQGTSEQIAEMVASDRIDCAIATGSEQLFGDLTLLPCYRWHRSVIVPRGHPLGGGGRLTLKALAAHPLITYTFSFTGPSSLNDAFAKAGLTPNVVITARDADVIETYVRLGLGVGIIAHMAVSAADPQLEVIDAAHLFAAHTTWIGFRRGTLLRRYMYDFAQLLAPHLERRLIERAHRAAGAEEVRAMFADVTLPQR